MSLFPARGFGRTFGKKAAFLLTVLLVGKISADLIVGGSPFIELIKTKLVLPSILMVGVIAFQFFGPIRAIKLYAFLWWIPLTAPQVPILTRFIGNVNIMEYFLYLIAGFGFLDILKHGFSSKRWHFFRNALVVMLPMCIAGIIGLARSIDYYYGVDYYRWSTIYPVAILFVMLYYVRNENEVFEVTKAFLNGAGIFALGLICLWATGHLYETANTLGGQRLGGLLVIGLPGMSGIGWDPVALGVSLSIVLPMLVGAIGSSGRVFSLKQSYAIMGIICSVVFLSAVRGAWINSLTGAFLTFGLVSVYAKRGIRILVLFGIIAVCLVFIYAFVGSDIDAMRYRIESLSNVENLITDPNLLGRYNILETHLDFVLNNPVFPFGYFYLNGLGNSHNMYVFLAVGTGFVGLACFLILVIMIAKRLVGKFGNANLKCRALIFGSFGSLGSMLVNGIADCGLNEAFFTAAIFVSLGLGLAATFVDDGTNARRTGRMEHGAWNKVQIK